MDKRWLGLIEKYLVRDPWKKAAFYKRHHYFHSIGEECYIAIHIWPIESYLMELGNNVWITGGVQIIHHDASVQVVRKALNYPWLDKIGRIRIGDNVFIGNHSILMPGINIGNNCIIGAGTVVSKDVLDNTVVAGNPMRVICSFEEYAEKCLKHTQEYPWREKTTGAELHDIRVKYFWEQGFKK